MGMVCLAIDTRFRDRKVVLKFPMRELLDDPTFTKRFIKETQRLIEVDHPNIVKVFDGGEHPRAECVLEREAGAGATEGVRFRSSGVDQIRALGRSGD